uniref:NACHT, LRR and PYD domains-containing protein 12-like n=1 Tax=Scleropages formosus TaxID=113540 RepID=A0A8C9V881_SCLFO
MDPHKSVQEQRPGSPAAICMSMRNDRSMSEPIRSSGGTTMAQDQRPWSPAPSCMSMKSDRSMPEPIRFSGGTAMAQDQRPWSPAPSCMSMKSDRSMPEPIRFSGGTAMAQDQRPWSPAVIYMSMRNDQSMSEPIRFSGGTAMAQDQRPWSPAVIYMSMRNDQSMSEPIRFSGGTAMAQDQRPGSPAAICMSMRNDRSMPEPIRFSGGTAMAQDQRPWSPAPSCMSMKSDRSMPEPIRFSGGTAMAQDQRPWSPGPSCMSMKSDRSMPEPIRFSGGTAMAQDQRPWSPAPSCMSMKSDRSMPEPIRFSGGTAMAQDQRPWSPGPSCMSMKSDRSMPEPIRFSGGTAMAQDQRPGSPAPSCMLMKSDRSMPEPIRFSGGTAMAQDQRLWSPGPSCMSMKSDRSMPEPIRFSGGTAMAQDQRPWSPAPSCMSMKSDRSMPEPIRFSGGTAMAQDQRPWSPAVIYMSMRNDQSMSEPIRFSGGTAMAQDQRPGSLAAICMSMRNDWSMPEPIRLKNGAEQDASVIYSSGHTNARGKRKAPPVASRVSVKRLCVRGRSNEFTGVTFPIGQGCLYTGYTSTSEKQQEMEPSDDKEEMLDQQSYIVVLQRHQLMEPSENLDPESFQRSKSNASLLREIHRDYDVRRVQMKHKTKLESTFKHIFEGIAKQGNPTLLNRIYTELYITEGEREGVNDEHEVWQIESAYRTHSSLDTPINCNDIFKCLPGQERTIRTVLTKGIAGIGKTVSVQKFILDWAEGKANQDIDFIFVLPFRELNLIKDEQYSLLELLHEFYPEIENIKDIRFNKYKVMLIFDGLDESRLPLNFHHMRLSDVKEATSVDVLLTNLIKRILLPSALLWITTRPAAASQIPPEYVDQVTEIRGFNDPQKEEYFHKRFSDEDLANRIISHIQSSRSLYIMCHIPVFCWISATVLEKMLGNDGGEEIPTTLTQMYTHFLLIQTNIKNKKYHGTNETDSRNVSQSDRDLILKLAELAFHQLEKGNIIFYETDLKDCDIDVSEVSVYSGVCTQIFKEESVMYKKKVYCFVHLSIQEFLAALYVIHCHASNKMDSLKLFSEKKSRVSHLEMLLNELHKLAVNKALESKNGHLDLFLRFLLGLSMDSNKSLLQGLFTQTESSSESIKKTVKYIKVLRTKYPSPERYMNLFLCLVELNDFSLLKKVQKYRDSSSGEKLTPAECSCLAYVLLMSNEVLDVFDISTFNTSPEGRIRLIPAVKCCRKAVLTHCKLTGDSCGSVVSALQSVNSQLTELDLSYNHLGDSGVKELCTGLMSPHCKLHTLRVKLCNLTEGSCEDLASVLKCPQSGLKDVELSDNDLLDQGVMLLSAGLKEPGCKLQRLGLSLCRITERGCSSLASALGSNPRSQLRELDLSYNHPGDSGVKLLSALPEKVNVDHAGQRRIRPGLLKYSCQFTLDPNTANRKLVLSEDKRTVTWRGEEQKYPDHPERFDCFRQVLCVESVSDRSYWEVQWTGNEAEIGVTYKGIKRKGDGDDCRLGYNGKSWVLCCTDKRYSVRHNNTPTEISASPSPRVGVYVDCVSGTLSFYSVSSVEPTLLYSFTSTFTEPLYPVFSLWGSDSSVSLCDLE